MKILKFCALAISLASLAAVAAAIFTDGHDGILLPLALILGAVSNLSNVFAARCGSAGKEDRS